MGISEAGNVDSDRNLLPRTNPGNPIHVADYFTNFSLIVPLPTEEAVEYALQLAAHASGIQLGNEMAADFPESLRDVTDDWLFETDANDASQNRGLWLHCSNGGIDATLRTRRTRDARMVD